jgi:hypothetical protein
MNTPAQTLVNRVAAAAGLLALASLAGPAAAQGRTDTIALTGQTATGAGGGTFASSLRNPVLNDAGQTAFRANITGGTSTEGIYRSSSGALAAIALQGQGAVGSGGGTFSDFGGFDLVLNQAGQTAFQARITGGSTTGGIYLSGSGNTLTEIALLGQSASGSGGGTFSSFANPVLNDAGQTAFRGLITGGTSVAGIYRNASNSGALTAIAVSGSILPGTGGGTPTLNFEPVLNNAGQTAFYAPITGGTTTGGIFRSSSGSALTPIALQGQSVTAAGGGTWASLGNPVLNNAGQIAFGAGITGGTSTAGIFRSSGSELIPIALRAQSATGAGVGTFSSLGTPALNDAGQTAFYASIAGGTSTSGIYRSSSSGSALTAVALQGQSATGAGGGTFSDFSVGGYAMNDAGLTAFRADIAGGTSTQGLYLGDGRETVAAQLQGAALAGKTVSSLSFSSSSLNRHGQFAYRATFTDGTQGNFLFTPTLRWRETFSSNWDNADRWTLGIAPAGIHDVSIDPSVALTVTGPAGSVNVRSLTVGSGTGFATLSLGGGTLGSSSPVQVASRGILTGSGTITTQVSNAGEVRADSLILSGGLANSGTVRGAATGNQRIDTSLLNLSGGLVRVDSGETLKLVGNAHSNSGSIELRGGEVQVTGLVTNDAAGRIVLNGGIARFSSGLVNNGQVQVSFGGGEVFGGITTHSGGRVILSGNSNTTFYDTVETRSGGELRVSAGATAVFFGQVIQRTGAIFSGTGTKFFEGGLSIGGSPGFGLDAGSVGFGSSSVYEAEIGGLTACTEACATHAALQNQSFDKYVVLGNLTLGGTLRLSSWNSFVAQAGNYYDLFDWGHLQGQFDAIDASGLQLAEGTVLDTSRLYTTGEIGVTAVPEPATWAFMGLGLLGLAGVVRRHRAEPSALST